MSEEIVYGEFGKWVECEYQSHIVHGWKLTNSLLGLDVNLLTGYVSYLLYQVGYVNDRLEGREWIDYLLDFDIVCIMVDLFGNKEPQPEFLKRKDGFRMGIVPVSVHLDRDLHKFGGKTAAETRHELITPHRTPFGLTIEPECEDAFFVVDPRIIQEHGEKFQKEKEIAKNLAGKDVYLSPEEVAKEYIPNRVNRSELNAEWKEIRNKAIKELTGKHPDVHFFLTRSMNEIEVHNLRIAAIEAEKKLQNGQYKDAIRDAGEICEGLLKLVYGNEFQLRDFWEEGENDIEKLFGRDIFQDFIAVRELRNKYSHAPIKKPKRDEALKAVMRTNMILKYFLDKSGAARG
jgi:hypothetical protein